MPASGYSAFAAFDRVLEDRGEGQGTLANFPCPVCRHHSVRSSRDRMVCGQCRKQWSDAEYCEALPPTSSTRAYFVDGLAIEEFWQQFQR